MKARTLLLLGVDGRVPRRSGLDQRSLLLGLLQR
jgi:hypothetical protein